MLHRLKILCAATIFLQSLDLLSTAVGLAAGGLERNPLVAHFGWTPLVLAKFGAVLGLASLPFIISAMPLSKQASVAKPSLFLIGGLAAFYAVVVASNFLVAA